MPQKLGKLSITSINRSFIRIKRQSSSRFMSTATEMNMQIYCHNKRNTTNRRLRHDLGLVNRIVILHRRPFRVFRHRWHGFVTKKSFSVLVGVFRLLLLGPMSSGAFAFWIECKVSFGKTERVIHFWMIESNQEENRREDKSQNSKRLVRRRRIVGATS